MLKVITRESQIQCMCADVDAFQCMNRRWVHWTNINISASAIWIISRAKYMHWPNSYTTEKNKNHLLMCMKSYTHGFKIQLLYTKNINNYSQWKTWISRFDDYRSCVSHVMREMILIQCIYACWCWCSSNAWTEGECIGQTSTSMQVHWI